MATNPTGGWRARVDAGATAGHQLADEVDRLYAALSRVTEERDRMREALESLPVIPCMDNTDGACGEDTNNDECDKEFPDDRTQWCWACLCRRARLALEPKP